MAEKESNMMTPVGYYMSKNLVTIDSDTTAFEIANKMLEERVSAVVVMDSGKPVGILTERDLTRQVSAKDSLTSKTPASINYALPIVSCLVFSMHNGKLTQPHDGFGTVDWDYQRIRSVERAMIMRSQGFIHPDTLVPEELEYNKGYHARMSKLNERFHDI